MTAPIGPRSAQVFSDLLYRGRVEAGDYAALGARWWRMLDALNDALKADPGFPLTKAFIRELASWPDGQEIEDAVLARTPEDPVPFSDDETPSKTLTLSQYLAAGSPGEWLIDDLILQNSIAMLFGQKESFKTFVAAGMAFCVALGRDWHGRRVRQGRVVYVLGEGGDTFKRRLHAWMKHTGQQPDDSQFHVRPEMPRLTDRAEAEAFIAEMIALRPQLLILDTLFWAYSGGDENSTADTARVLDALKAIQRATGCAVLLLHHPAKDGDGPRGASAAPNGIDTMIEAIRKDNTDFVTLYVRKQKDGEKLQPIVLQSLAVDTGLATNDERPIWSLVLQRSAGENAQVPRQVPRGNVHPETVAKALAILDAAGPDGLYAGAWEEKSGISGSTLARLKHQVTENGQARSAEEGNYVRWTSTRFPPTTTDFSTTKQVPNETLGADPSTDRYQVPPPPPSSLKGGGGLGPVVGVEKSVPDGAS